MRVKRYLDFRGGLVTNAPTGIAAPNELLEADNVYWRNGLIKRAGIQKYTTTTLSGSVVGGIRAPLNDTYYSVIAVDSGTEVHFYQGNGATLATIPSATFTTGNDVSIEYLNGQLLAVNGIDDPIIITNTGSWGVQTVDEADTRELASTDWWAGGYDDSATAKYDDDTADAQSSTTADFAITTDITNDGFWVASDFTFNKVTFKSAAQAGGTPAVTYQYFNTSATWASLTMVASASWAGAAGDKYIEFDWPSDWAALDYSTETAGSPAVGRWAIRGKFTTPPSATFACAYLELEHTQKFTEIMGGEKPYLAVAHGNRMWLATDGSVIVNYSPPNSLTGWRAREVEYFLEGGDTVRGITSFRGNAIMYKDTATYAYFGDSFDNFVRRKVSDNGIVSKDSAAVVGNYAFRVCHDGIYVFDGDSDTKVTKHVQDAFDALTISNACGFSYQNEYWISFPDDSKVWVIDPDTIRRDSMGDAVVSVFVLSSYKVNHFLNGLAADDVNKLLGTVNATAPYIAELEAGTKDIASTSTSIAMTVQTTYQFEEGPETRFLRIWPRVREASATLSYTMTLLADEGANQATQTISVASGSGVYSEYFTVPYEMDGRDFAVKVEEESMLPAGFYGFMINYEERRF
jgi:hypothetical protein